MMRPVLACLTLLALAAPGLAAPAPMKPFLWRVEGPGAGKPDWVFGTMHVPLKPGTSLPAKLEAAVKQASRFVMEVDLSTVDAGMIGEYAHLEPGEDLKALVGPAAWPKLVKLTAARGLPESELRKLDPWFVALTFLPTPGDEAGVIDSRLEAIAKRSKVPIAYLEEAEDQFKALDGVAMKEDLAQLMEIVDEPGKPAAEMAGLEKAYLAGDQAAVEQYLFEASRVKTYPDFYDKVFYRRNARWLPAVEAAMRRERAFVAVGLGHLLGEKGLLKGLQARGFRVTREAL